MERPVDDVILRRSELARIAGVKPDSVMRWEQQGICPPPIAVGPQLKGQWKSVWVQWLDSRREVRR